MTSSSAVGRCNDCMIEIVKCEEKVLDMLLVDSENMANQRLSI